MALVVVLEARFPSWMGWTGARGGPRLLGQAAGHGGCEEQEGEAEREQAHAAEKSYPVERRDGSASRGTL